MAHSRIVFKSFEDLGRYYLLNVARWPEKRVDFNIKANNISSLMSVTLRYDTAVQHDKIMNRFEIFRVNDNNKMKSLTHYSREVMFITGGMVQLPISTGMRLLA